jgi:hypothetical protein
MCRGVNFGRRLKDEAIERVGCVDEGDLKAHVKRLGVLFEKSRAAFEELARG